jgi:predicted nucleotidyltransferase
MADLFYLLKHYYEAGNSQRLYDEAFPLLAACGYDVELGGAALLGSDVRLILGDATCLAVMEILRDPVKRDRLVIHMDRSFGADANAASRLLMHFERGLAPSD